MNIDWHGLRLQKEWLTQITIDGTTDGPYSRLFNNRNVNVEMAAGLLGLLDALQDEAASSGLASEEEIFGTTEERE